MSRAVTPAAAQCERGIVHRGKVRRDAVLLQDQAQDCSAGDIQRRHQGLNY